MKQYTPTKSENLKLKEKSEVVTNITHASQRNYKLVHKKYVKVYFISTLVFKH